MIDRPDGTQDYLFMVFHSEVRVRTDDGDQVWTSPSLMVWEPPDSHFYGNEEGGWDHSWFHCSGRAVTSSLQASELPLRRRVPVTDASLMERFLLEATAELNGWSQPDATILRNLFENFVRASARQAFRKSAQFAPARLLAIRSHAEQHFHERLSLGDLARWAGWSAPHLCSEFRRFFGIPVMQFVQTLRMSQAAYLLRDRNRRIGEIADAVGYVDLFTFSKMFKRHFGVSPRKFRELNSPSVPARLACARSS